MTEAHDAQIRTLRGEKASWDKIAAALGVSRTTAIQRGAAIGIMAPPRKAAAPVVNLPPVEITPTVPISFQIGGVTVSLVCNPSARPRLALSMRRLIGDGPLDVTITCEPPAPTLLAFAAACGAAAEMLPMPIVGEVVGDEFGERLKQVREKLGVSVNDLAARLGTAQQRVFNWERRGYAPPLRKLRPIARALGCRIVDLVGEV